CPGRPWPVYPPGLWEPGAADPRILRWYAPPHGSATLAPRTGCAGDDPRPVRRDRDGRPGAVRPGAGRGGGGAGDGRRCRAGRRSRGGGARSWRPLDRRASGTRVAAVHDAGVRSASPGGRATAGCGVPRPDAARRGRAEGDCDPPTPTPPPRPSTPTGQPTATPAPPAPD